MGTNAVKAAPHTNKAEKLKLLRADQRVRKATLVTELPPIDFEPRQNADWVEN